MSECRGALDESRRYAGEWQRKAEAQARQRGKALAILDHWWGRWGHVSSAAIRELVESLRTALNSGSENAPETGTCEKCDSVSGGCDG